MNALTAYYFNESVTPYSKGEIAGLDEKTAERLGKKVRELTAAEKKKAKAGMNQPNTVDNAVRILTDAAKAPNVQTVEKVVPVMVPEKWAELDEKSMIALAAKMNGVPVKDVKDAEAAKAIISQAIGE